MTTGVEQLTQGVDRLLRAGAERVTPLREVKEETTVLRRRLEELESALAELEQKRRNETVEQAATAPGESVPGETVGSTTD